MLDDVARKSRAHELGIYLYKCLVWGIYKVKSLDLGMLYKQTQKWTNKWKLILIKVLVAVNVAVADDIKIFP